MAQLGEPSVGTLGHHITPWGHQLGKRHSAQDLAQDQSRLASQHHVCGPLKEMRKLYQS